MPDADASTDPMAQLDIEQEIRRLSRLLEVKTQDFAELAAAAAGAEHRYKLERAKAHLVFKRDTPKATVADLEALVTLSIDAWMLSHLSADAAMRACQEACRNLRSQLDALRSLNANVRTLVTG